LGLLTPLGTNGISQTGGGGPDSNLATHAQPRRYCEVSAGTKASVKQGASNTRQRNQEKVHHRNPQDNKDCSSKSKTQPKTVSDDSLDIAKRVEVPGHGGIQVCSSKPTSSPCIRHHAPEQAADDREKVNAEQDEMSDQQKGDSSERVDEGHGGVADESRRRKRRGGKVAASLLGRLGDWVLQRGSQEQWEGVGADCQQDDEAQPCREVVTDVPPPSPWSAAKEAKKITGVPKQKTATAVNTIKESTAAKIDNQSSFLERKITPTDQNGREKP